MLLSEPVTADRLREMLSEFEYLGCHDSVADTDASTTLVYRFREQDDGHMLVTLSESPWPDDLGDPDSTPERFIAWSLGQYGPYAFPGCLRRAGEQSWGWEEGHEAITEHKCHLRFLISYVFGGDEIGVDAEVDQDQNFALMSEPDGEQDGEHDNDPLEEFSDESEDEPMMDSGDPLDSEIPMLPNDYDPHAEMAFITRAVEAALQMPEAICYFNPAGEVLRDRDGLRRGLNHAWSHDLPPLEMWTNVRLFRAEDGWSLMDTVGNCQFDVPDLEAVFSSDQYEPSKVEEFLRSASLYLMKSDEDVEDGDTADGPGGIQWRAMECVDGLSDPPRETIRWFPQDNTEPPESMADPGEDGGEEYDSQYDPDEHDDDDDDDEI